MSKLFNLRVRGDLKVNEVKSTFNCLLGEQEKEVIYEMYCRFKQVKLSESPEIMRLENLVIEGTDLKELNVSVTSMYDFVVSNMLVYTYDDLNKFVTLFGSDTEKFIWYRISPDIKSMKEELVDYKILDAQFLSNPLALSILVHDEEDNFILTLRGSDKIMASNFYGVTSTETLRKEDMDKNSPILACAERGIETDFKIDSHILSYSVNMLFMGENKKQPVIMVDCVSHIPANEFVKDSMKGIGHSKSDIPFIVSGKDRLKLFVASNKMTEAAKAHIMSIT